MRPILLAMAAAAAILLLACAAPQAAPVAPSSACAALLVTAADWPSGKALADEAARRAGVAVTTATALSGRIFALTLDCASEADCLRAIERLGADTRFAVEVQPDRRRALPPRPSASSAQ